MSFVKATIMVAMVVLVEVVLPMSIVDISILIVCCCRFVGERGGYSTVVWKCPNREIGSVDYSGELTVG